MIVFLILFLVLVPGYKVNAAGQQFSQTINPLECYFDSVNLGPVIIQNLSPEECQKAQENIVRNGGSSTSEVSEQASAPPVGPVEIIENPRIGRPDRTDYFVSNNSSLTIQRSFELIVVVAGVALIGSMARLGWLKIPFRRRG